MSNNNATRVQVFYEKVKKLTLKSLRNGKWNEALNRIELAAHIGYTYNQFYIDLEYEKMLTSISNKIIVKQSDFVPIVGRFVFYDSFGFSNRGLVHQYLRALMSWNVEFLYILGSDNTRESKVLLDEIKEYKKAEIYIVDTSLTKDKQILRIFNIITNFRPQKAFLYLSPWDVVALTAFQAISQTTKYLINLTDHAFWLGVSCLDYSIEFRDFGCNITEQKRGISTEKILLQPFYPIVITTKFQGFPREVTSDKVVIFSGGAYYKIYGDNNRFFYLLKRLLDEFPQTIILFAGWGDDKPIKSFISENQFEKRLFLLGLRSDINEIFANCDIYLGSYPISGGLMSQYAAINAKPILAFAASTDTGVNVEDFVPLNSELGVTLTHTKIDGFFKEAKILIENKDYRENIGILLKNSIITPNNFNSELYLLISTHKNEHKIKNKFIDFDKISNQYLNEQNIKQSDIWIYFLKTFKISLTWIFPSILIRLTPSIILKLRKQIFN